MTEIFEPPPPDPTIEVSLGLSQAEVRLCPGCGKPEQLWEEDAGRGYVCEEGNTYCCRGCAEEIGCTCV